MNEGHWTAKKPWLARTILIGAAGICFGALSYFVYHYEIRGDRQFAGWSGVVVYNALPAAVAVLLLCSLRLRPLLQTALAAGCVLIAASAYGAELVLQFSGPKVTSM